MLTGIDLILKDDFVLCTLASGSKQYVDIVRLLGDFKQLDLSALEFRHEDRKHGVGALPQGGVRPGIWQGKGAQPADKRVLGELACGVVEQIVFHDFSS